MPALILRQARWQRPGPVPGSWPLAGHPIVTSILMTIGLLLLMSGLFGVDPVHQHLAQALELRQSKGWSNQVAVAPGSIELPWRLWRCRIRASVGGSSCRCCNREHRCPG